jgi:hypothetical protein
MVVMLERSEASGGGVFIDICTFLHFGHFSKELMRDESTASLL